MQFEPIDGGLRVRAPAKINLFLEVGPRREDGFHDIDSVFQAVSLYDEIELVDAPGAGVSLEEAGIDDREQNLVWRAADLMRRSDWCPADSGVRIRLRKRIPQGGGLGGGSSDAAATLLALRRLWGGPDDVGELLPLASELGSDVPFFLWGGTARCTGRGELVEPLDPVSIGVEGLGYVLICSDVRVNTGIAYGAIDAARDPNLSLTLRSPPLSILPAGGLVGAPGGEDGARSLFFNRFESVVYSLFDSLATLYGRLRQEPFTEVMLSGSGATIFGVCPSPAEARELAARLDTELEADVFAVERVEQWTRR